MKKDKKLKNFIKTTVRKFLNEQINDKSYKIGENIWYKNQYMDTPKLVKIDNIEEYTNGEINSITIKFDSGNTDKILKHQFKYLSKQKQIKDDYTIVKEIGDQIADIINYQPNQISELFNFIKNNQKSGDFKISFTEEVKDGRTPRFNINSVMKLKGKVIGDDFKFKINDIKFIENYKQDSDYNDYINYVYNITFEKVEF
jgi:hypothetical protein